MALIESLTADEIVARLADKISAEELTLALAMKAALESPTFTGVPQVPTAATASNDTTAASTAFVKAALALLVDSSPATLDTLNELAAALGDDPNFATTMLDALAGKAPLNSPALTGSPTAPTPTTGSNDTSVATTAFVTNAIADGESGVYTYADSAEFLAETTTRDGIILAPTGANWGVDFGTGFPTTVESGIVFVRTQATVVSGVDILTQWVVSGSSTGLPTGMTLARRKSGFGSWTDWSSKLYGNNIPTDNYELTSKLYVDARSLNNLAAWADLDTVVANHSRAGLVNAGAAGNLGTLTGIAKYDAWGGGELWYESHGTYDADYYSTQVQKVWIPNLDGSVDEIRRYRNDSPSWSMNAWSAWEIYVPETGGSSGAGEPVGLVAGGLAPRYAVSPNGANGTTALSTDNPDVIVFDISSPCRLRSISFRISTAGESGNLIKLWLYEEGSFGSVPDTLLHDFGSVAGDVTSNGTVITPGTPIDLSPGYYMMVMGDTATTTHALVTGGASAGPVSDFPGRLSSGQLSSMHVAATRAQTRLEGISMSGSAPNPIAYNPVSGPRTIEGDSGKRVITLVLDLIPTA